jgi:hypothetical protein
LATSSGSSLIGTWPQPPQDEQFGLGTHPPQIRDPGPREDSVVLRPRDGHGKVGHRTFEPETAPGLGERRPETRCGAEGTRVLHHRLRGEQPRSAEDHPGHEGAAEASGRQSSSGAFREALGYDTMSPQHSKRVPLLSPRP